MPKVPNSAQKLVPFSSQIYRFAPHDPSQNPIEDIWNQAKAFVWQQWAHLTSFLDVTTAFEQFLDGRVFDFPKLHRYCPDVQIT